MGDRPRGPDDLDDASRERMRRIVLAGIGRRRRGPADVVYDGVVLLGAPAPLIVRTLTAALLVTALVGAATVASAESLPGDPLYSLKVSAEAARLVLAGTDADRAAVEVSTAEHRLTEAERLVTEGRDAEAAVAASEYGSHLANAAAAIATTTEASNGLAAELRERLERQQYGVAGAAAHLQSDAPASAGAQIMRSLASTPPAIPPDAAAAVGIADHAAEVARQAAGIAERLADAAPGPAGGDAAKRAKGEADKARGSAERAHAGPPARTAPDRPAGQPHGPAGPPGRPAGPPDAHGQSEHGGIEHGQLQNGRGPAPQPGGGERSR